MLAFKLSQNPCPNPLCSLFVEHRHNVYQNAHPPSIVLKHNLLYILFYSDKREYYAYNTIDYVELAEQESEKGRFYKIFYWGWIKFGKNYLNRIAINISLWYQINREGRVVMVVKKRITLPAHEISYTYR